jgi:hypothetical protein
MSACHRPPRGGPTARSTSASVGPSATRSEAHRALERCSRPGGADGQDASRPPSPPALRPLVRPTGRPAAPRQGRSRAARTHDRPVRRENPPPRPVRGRCARWREACTRLTTSVVIPARNEAATVGEVAGTLRRTLLDRSACSTRCSSSTPTRRMATGDEARAAGARVVRQSDVLPRAGTALGKGEALWKGLAASEGDLVVFVDADIRDIGPRFVVGLLGPLLLDDGVRFTKATYDRPLEVGADARRRVAGASPSCSLARDRRLLAGARVAGAAAVRRVRRRPRAARIPALRAGLRRRARMLVDILATTVPM